MKILHSPNELDIALKPLRKEGKRIGLIPTMGALHKGHLSLVETLRTKTDILMASIFVNPTQFAPHEDFETYPRNEKKDLSLLEQSGTDFAYIPEIKHIYPQSLATEIIPTGAADGLESINRPHFFAGVATLILKLFSQCQPDIAIFGEKDYQQLLVIRQIVKDLNLPIEIASAPTIREVDGLALSSRNQYLTEAERQIAPKLYETLCSLAEQESPEQHIEQAKSKLEKTGFKVDYLELRKDWMRLLAATWLGTTRLIDNIALSDKP